jgi:hypothetical protein
MFITVFIYSGGYIRKPSILSSWQNYRIESYSTEVGDKTVTKEKSKNFKISGGIESAGHAFVCLNLGYHFHFKMSSLATFKKNEINMLLCCGKSVYK